MNFYILKQTFGNYAQATRDGRETTTDFYNAPPYKIISPALQNVLTQHGFTGFSFDDLEITG